MVPEGEFELMHEACTIRSSSYSEADRKVRKCDSDGKNCRDVWECWGSFGYNFTYDGQEWPARSHDSKRCDNSQCVSCPAVPMEPLWGDDEVVDCWRPTVEEPSPDYKCGN